MTNNIASSISNQASFMLTAHNLKGDSGFSIKNILVSILFSSLLATIIANFSNKLFSIYQFVLLKKENKL